LQRLSKPCDHSHFQKRVRVRKPDGTLRWLKSYALPLFPVEGGYAGHVEVSIDITDTVNAENALREAGRLKDEFLATLAHELRNPLAPVASALTLLEHADNSAARRSPSALHHQPAGQLHGTAGG
jgi:signal transduction histidine kinase